MIEKNPYTIGYIDVLTNTLLLAFVLAIFSIAMMNPESKNTKTIEQKAEFLIVMDWDNHSDDDIDLWVKTPQNKIVSYGNKESHLIALDRDDLGKSTDTTFVDGRTITIPINREVVSIRGFLVGELIVNLHVYNKREKNPANITIQIIKLNPYSVLYKYEYVSNTHGQEITVGRFTLTSLGDFVFKNNMPISLIREKKW